MGANPLTFSEIEAFGRTCLVPMSAWEVQLIERLDDTVLAVWGEKLSKRKRPEASDAPEPVPVSNARGIKALLQGLAIKKAKS